MSKKYLGLPFDIHGGGSDLIFPHHENERAQSMCGYGCDFVNYWMHSGMLQIANEQGTAEKMSKSLNNFILLHEALEQVRPSALRMLALQTHYRSPLVFGQKRLEEADAALKRIENTVHNLDWSIANAGEKAHSIDVEKLKAAIERTHANFVEAMDDDFNCSKALGEIFALIADINNLVGDRQISTDDAKIVQDARDKIVELMNVFGVVLEGVSGQDDSGAGTSSSASTYPDEVIEIAKEFCDFSDDSTDEAVQALLLARTDARKNKQFDIADGIRDKLGAIGLKIEDTPQGPRVTK